MTNDPQPTIVRVEQIQPNPWNPNSMADVKFAALKRSIKKYPDILYGQRIIVWQNPEHEAGIYEILNGEHRWRACKALGILALPVYIVAGLDLAHAKLLSLALANTGVEDEEGKLSVIQSILGDYNIDKIAGMIGVDDLELRTAVESMMLQDPKEVDAIFDSYKIGPALKEPTDAEMAEVTFGAVDDDDDDDQTLEYVGADYGDDDPIESAVDNRLERLKKLSTGGKTTDGYIDIGDDASTINLLTRKGVKKLLMWNFDTNGALDPQGVIELACAAFMDSIDEAGGIT